MNDEINKKDDSMEVEASPEAPVSHETEAEQKKPEEKGIDLEKEIEDLDDFLSEGEDDEGLIIEDEDHILTASSFAKDGKKSESGKSGKFLGYGAFAILLCGLLYGGVVYGPQMFDDSEFEAFKENMASRSVGAADIGLGEPLPVSVDEAENADVAVAEGETLVSSEDVIALDNTEPAETIADALALTQNSMTADEPVSDNEFVELAEDNTTGEVSPAADTPVETKVEAAVAPVDMAEEAIIEADVKDEVNDTIFERTPAVSLADTRKQVAEQEDGNDLPPLAEDKVEVANDVMVMPEKEITELVEAVEEVNEPVDLKETVIKAREDAAAREKEVEAAKADVKVQAESVKEDAVVKTAEPVVKAVKKATVKKAPEPIDPRVKTAQDAYNLGEYESALELYEAVLIDNPADTHALTGRQLAQAKIRMAQQSKAPVASYVETVVTSTTTEVVQEEPVVTDAPTNTVDDITWSEAPVSEAPEYPSIKKEDIVFFNSVRSTANNSGAEYVNEIPVKESVSEVVTEYVSPIAEAPVKDVVTAVTAAPKDVNDSMLADMIGRAESNPENPSLALAIADIYKEKGDKDNAREWYRNALKYDAMYTTGLDRMDVYRRLAELGMDGE